MQIIKITVVIILMGLRTLAVSQLHNETSFHLSRFFQFSFALFFSLPRSLFYLPYFILFTHQSRFSWIRHTNGGWLVAFLKPWILKLFSRLYYISLGKSRGTRWFERRALLSRLGNLVEINVPWNDT